MPPSPQNESPAARYLPFILWLIPVIFGAGGTIAAISNVSSSADKTSARLDAHLSERQAEERRLQSMQSRVEQLDKTLDKQSNEIEALRKDVKSLELNVAVLCRASKGIRCEK